MKGALKKMQEIMWSVGRIALLAYVGLALFMYFRQSRYVFYPVKGLGVTPATAGLAYEDVSVKTTDGETIHGWFVPAGTNAMGTLLLCHGNAGNIWNRIDAIWLFHDLGLNVCVFDYRGYGKSTGAPSEEGTYLDAAAVWDWLVQQRAVKPATIAVFGESLGGAVAAWLADKENPGALVLESSFTSLPDMAARLYPFLPVRWLCKFRYNTLERISRITCPVLVAHSRQDEMIPFAHGQRLYAAAREPKAFLEMKGSHNGGREETGEAYSIAVRGFLDQHLGAGMNP